MPPPSSRDGDLFDRATHWGEVGGGRPRMTYETFLSTYRLEDSAVVKRAWDDAVSYDEAAAYARRATTTARPTGGDTTTASQRTYDDRHADDGLLD